MRRRSSSNLQPALGTIQEYPPSSPAESPKRQISSVSSSESPTSPLSPSSQEVEKRLEDAKQNAEENRKNIQSVIGRLELEIGTKATKNAIGSDTLGELSGDVQDPSANNLWQRRSQSK